jgi:hypothetical protein
MPLDYFFVSNQFPGIVAAVAENRRSSDLSVFIAPLRLCVNLVPDNLAQVSYFAIFGIVSTEYAQ